MRNCLQIKIPDFEPQYEVDVTYGYKDEAKKRNLKNVLYQSSRGYCMYCYSRILVDGKEYGQIEHALEKSNSHKLEECTPNMGISCSICNQSLKRAGERTRKISKDIIEEFENNTNCHSKCIKRCESYEKLFSHYIHQDEAQIILQPMGVYGSDTGNRLRLQYDTLNSEFIPCEPPDSTYSENEISFIQKHIKRFNLNDPVRKSKQLIIYVKDVIDHDGLLPKLEKNNLIVEIFADELKGKSKEEILKICQLIYSLSVLKFN